MRSLPTLLALLAATPVAAQERDYCPERPGVNTPACIVDAGRVSVETALGDWTRDDMGAQRTDTLLVADTLVRVGVSERVEARVGWTPFIHVRERDVAGIRSVDGVGDLTFGAKVGLLHPDGSGVSVAVLPFATAPVGRRPAGAGDWSTGVLMPVSWELSDAVSLAATPELDAAVDEDGHGRHFAASLAAGVGVDLSDTLTLTGEAQVLRDDDPAGRTTQALAALSLGWKVGKDLQLDVFGAAGLNRDTPDAELSAGVSRRF